MKPISYRQVISLAWPASIASLITPVLGLIDSAALGYSDRPLDIGAVGLAASIYALLYWAFGFLRMSTAGLTAQAHGADDALAMRRILGQSVMVGLVAGGLLTLLQYPLEHGLFWLFTRGSQITAETNNAAHIYFSIRIWSAPFAIATFGLLGWLTARGRTDMLLLVTAVMTLLNAALDALFVIKFQWGAAGVAWGTLIAEALGFFLALLIIFRILEKEGGWRQHWQRDWLLKLSSYRPLIGINTDIFIRSLLLSAAFAYFVQRGSVFGDIVLSANQVLLQLVLVTGLALDGAAIAAETLVGQSLGQRDKTTRLIRYDEAVWKTSITAAIGALIFTLLLLIAGEPLLRLIAPDPHIIAAARTYLPWAIISPLIVVTCFQLDGIFIGATRFRAMRNAMIIATAMFALSSIFFINNFGNHGLWAAFWLYMLLRAVGLAVLLPPIRRSAQT